MPRDLDWLTARPIAHRGLHDSNVAVMENSATAAEKALAAGYAVECDVRLSSDRVPMIFHDETLERLTAASGPVSTRSADELSALALGTSTDRIPTVEAFLALVDGSIPIVLEMKGTTREADSDVLERLAPLLDVYSGPLALMSFEPWLIEQALAYGKRPVGLTAEGTRPSILDEHREIYAKGCAFLSYNVHHLPNAFVSYVREERGDPVITWTVRTPIDVETTRHHADQMTFEGFLPQL